jgi:DNA ligase-4
MTLTFSVICELLTALEQSQNPDCASKSNTTADKSNAIVRAWFDKYDLQIPRRGREAVAFLSCLFPERRADRVYGLKESRLEGIIQHALGLGASSLKELRSWRHPDRQDFASTVHRVAAMTNVAPPHQRSVTITEIDETLDRIASISPFSSDTLKDKVKSGYPQPV